MLALKNTLRQMNDLPAWLLFLASLACGWDITYLTSSVSLGKQNSAPEHSESHIKRNKNQLCMDRYAGERKLFVG